MKIIRLSIFSILFISLSQIAFGCDETNIRYSTSSDRIYVEEGAVCRISDIDTLVVAKYSSVSPNQLLEELTPGVWLLKSEMRIEDGSTLELHGTSIGGDVDTLLLRSDNGPAPSHVKIQAKYGTVDINSTLVTTWDSVAQGPDTDSSNGRAFIHINSLETNGVAQESRMDIINSEVSYLGFYDSESYGLVWKVRGGNIDHTIYDRVDVYGDIINSYIHHNYMGMYSFGSYQMILDNNEVAFNESYGIDPHDDSDWLTITNNDVHDNGNHGIICSRRCNDLIIAGNTSYRNRHGIMLHRDTNDTLVENNTVYDNNDNGIAVFESHNNIIRGNIITGNKHGIRLSLGSHDNLIEENTIEDSEGNGLYLYSGSDLPETTDGRPADNIFINNILRNNGRLIKSRDADNIIFDSNSFEGETDVEIYDSTNVEIVGNSHLFTKLEARLDGTSELPANASIELDENAAIKLSDFSTMTLINNDGRILDPEENSGMVTATYNMVGSSPVTTTNLELTSNIIGSSTEVTALPFWIELNSGAAEIRQPSFSSSSKSWSINAVGASVSAEFRVSDLTSGISYDVLKDSAPFASIVASSEEIVFVDTITVSEVEYAVVRNGTAIGVEVLADTYVRDGFPDTNYGAATTLETKVSGEGYNRQVYFIFDISSFSSPIASVTIAFTGELSRPGSVTTNIHAADSGWSESTMTWNSKPNFGAILGSVTIASDNFSEYEIDVTSYINSLISVGAQQAGIALINDASSTAVTRISSKESGPEAASKLFVTP